MLEQFQGRDDLLLSPENSITQATKGDVRAAGLLKGRGHGQIISDKETATTQQTGIRNVNNGTAFRQNLV